MHLFLFFVFRIDLFYQVVLILSVLLKLSPVHILHLLDLLTLLFDIKLQLFLCVFWAVRVLALRTRYTSSHAPSLV